MTKRLFKITPTLCIFFVCGLITYFSLCYSDLFAARQKRDLRVGRVKQINQSARVGVLVSGSTTTDVKKVVDGKYNKYFIKCITGEQYCGDSYDKCFDTTDANMKSNLSIAKESCFRQYFSGDGDLEKIRQSVFALLSDDMLKLCTEDNNRQKLPNNGCQAMVINQSPGYMRYKDCIRNACLAMDGSVGDFSGCFGRKNDVVLNQAVSECLKVLSTYSISLSNNIKQTLLKEISDLEERACTRMSGKYNNGSCKLYVGYTRERYMMKKHKLKGIDFYAVTESGDPYKVTPSNFPAYPNFGKFESASLFEIGSDVFCAYTSFGLPKLFQYDSTYDAQYGSGMTGTAPGGGMGGADMALMVGAIGTIPAITGLLSKKEGTAKLTDQVTGIDIAKDGLKKIAPTIMGMATVSSDKGRAMRIGDEIKGTCILQGGMSYNEGDTITIRWQ